MPRSRPHPLTFVLGVLFLALITVGFLGLSGCNFYRGIPGYPPKPPVTDPEPQPCQNPPCPL